LEATQTEQFHGSATIYSGSVVIVRNAENLIFNSSDSLVEIQEGDLIRVGLKGNLRLNFRSGDRITLGSNAILQVRRWFKGQRKGNLRMLFGKFRARTMDGNKRRVMSIRTTTTIVGIRGSLGEGNTGSDFTNLANLDGDMTIAGEEIPFGEAGFKLDDQLEGLSGLAAIPNFDPDLSADERETQAPETLNTTDTKNPDLSVGITEVSLQSIEPVSDSEGDVVPEVSDREEAQENLSQIYLIEDLNVQVEETADAAATAREEKVKILIEVEN